MKNSLYIKILLLVFIFSLGFNTVYAASPSLFLNPAKKQVGEGDKITVSVRVQSTDQAINAISGSITFPDSLLSVSSISKDGSIISLWIQEPRVSRNKISFEGVALTPGFQGQSGLVFNVTFNAKRTGIANLSFSEGALLANDGLGTNILTRLNSTSFEITPRGVLAQGEKPPTQEVALPINNKVAALPVIIEYAQSVESSGKAYLKGKGEPNALTKIIFKDISFKSIGEQFIEFLQTEKKKLDEVLVKNNPDGTFEYTSANNLVAGVYNATPFLVDADNNTEKPGLGVQFLISDSKVVKYLVVVINVLGLLIPVVGLIVVIYFIPWYSWRRMRVLKKKLGLEEEKLEITSHQLERQDKVENINIDKMINPDKQL